MHQGMAVATIDRASDRLTREAIVFVCTQCAVPRPATVRRCVGMPPCTVRVWVSHDAARTTVNRPDFAKKNFMTPYYVISQSTLTVRMKEGPGPPRPSPRL